MVSRWEISQTDPYLTKLSLDYANRPGAFIASQMMPIIDTQGILSGLYRRFKKGNMFRTYDDAVARLARTSRVVIEMDTDGTFACVPRGLHDGIAARDAKAFMTAGLSLQEYATRVVTDAILLGREYRVASLLTSASYLTNYAALTGNDRWDVYTAAASDPFDDVETMRSSIHSTTGQEMNRIMLGRQVYNKLKHHPVIIDRIKYTMGIRDGKVTPELLAAAFDVERVLVGNPLYVTTKLGQSVTLGYVWGKNVIGAYVEPAPTNFSRTLGFIFSALGVLESPLMREWNEEGPNATFVEGGLDEDEVICDANCGYLLQTVVS